jgi:hypothetical protein
MPNTIALKFSGRYDEGRAGGVIKPGHLIKLNGDNEVVVHATAGQKVMPAFAWEDALQGKTVDDAYADGDLVNFGICNPGDEVLAILKDEQNVDEGALLESAGTGALQAVTTGTPIAEAREAVNLTGAAGDGFCKVRIL